MICNYLDIYKNGILLNSLVGIHTGDELIVVVREDRYPQHSFVEWQDADGNRTDPYPEELDEHPYGNYRTFRFIITCGSTFRAAFAKNELPKYTVTVTSSGECGTVSGGGEYERGSDVTLTATVTDECCCEFDGWYENNVFKSNTTNYTIANITESHTFEGRFSDRTFDVEFSVVGNGNGSVDGGGTYSCGDVAVFTETHEDDTDFVGWFNGDILLSAESTYSIEVDCNVVGMNLTARFNLKNTYNIYVTFDNIDIDSESITLI